MTDELKFNFIDPNEPLIDRTFYFLGEKSKRYQDFGDSDAIESLFTVIRERTWIDKKDLLEHFPEG